VQGRRRVDAYLDGRRTRYDGRKLSGRDVAQPEEHVKPRVRAGDGDAIPQVVVERGEQSTTTGGQALPVRFMHRVSASREGVNGPTRTIVLNRTLGEDSSAELRASEIRFTRFFNSTPIR